MLAYWTPGPGEIIVILVIALLVFGRRLPETGRSLGLGIKEFKKGLKGITEEDEAKGAIPPEEGRVIEGRSEPRDDKS